MFSSCAMTKLAMTSRRSRIGPDDIIRSSYQENLISADDTIFVTTTFVTNSFPFYRMKSNYLIGRG